MWDRANKIELIFLMQSTSKITDYPEEETDDLEHGDVTESDIRFHHPGIKKSEIQIADSDFRSHAVFRSFVWFKTDRKLNTRLTSKNKTHTVNVRLLDYSVQTTFINSFGSII